MPVQAGGNPEGGRGFGSVNKRQYEEIVAGIIEKISYGYEVQRTRNSIKTSKNFHLDAAVLSSGTHAGQYKVDIQFKGGSKDTVAQAIVPDDPNVSHNDVREALEESLRNRQKYIVT